MSGSYELYAEVLRRTAVKCAEELGWELEPVRSSFLPNSIPYWKPYRDTNANLDRLHKKYQLGLLSNIDDKLLGATRRHFRSDFDLVVTAQQVRSYKPEPAHFKECQRRIGGKNKWVHIATGLESDVLPCLKLKIPVIWINKKKEAASEHGAHQAGRRGQGPARGLQAAEGETRANRPLRGCSPRRGSGGCARCRCRPAPAGSRDRTPIAGAPPHSTQRPPSRSQTASLTSRGIAVRCAVTGSRSRSSCALARSSRRCLRRSRSASSASTSSSA